MRTQTFLHKWEKRCVNSKKTRLPDVRTKRFALCLLSESLQRDSPCSELRPDTPPTPHELAMNCHPVHRFRFPIFLWIDRLITRYQMSPRQTWHLNNLIECLLNSYGIFGFLEVYLENLIQMFCQSVRCITIHGNKNHQRHFEPFSGGRAWDFMVQAGKSRAGRFSGARNEALW